METMFDVQDREDVGAGSPEAAESGDAAELVHAAESTEAAELADAAESGATMTENDACEYCSPVDVPGSESERRYTDSSNEDAVVGGDMRAIGFIPDNDYYHGSVQSEENELGFGSSGSDAGGGNSWSVGIGGGGEGDGDWEGGEEGGGGGGGRGGVGRRRGWGEGVDGKAYGADRMHRYARQESSRYGGGDDFMGGDVPMGCSWEDQYIR